MLVFEGKKFSVEILENRPPYGYELVHHPGAAVILPLASHEMILMIKNERHVIKKKLWELPAGTLESSEKPIETARRELLEETGYSAEILRPLFNFYSSPGFCDERISVFVAENLSYEGQDLDEHEVIEVHEMSWTEALKLIQKGEITDGKTVATLLYYHLFSRLGCNRLI